MIFVLALLLFSTISCSGLSVSNFLQSAYCIQKEERIKNACDFPVYASDECDRKGVEEIGTTKIFMDDNGNTCMAYESTDLEWNNGGYACGEGIVQLQQCILELQDKYDLADKTLGLFYIQYQYDWAIWLQDKKNVNNDVFCYTDYKGRKFLDSKKFWTKMEDTCQQRAERLQYCTKNDCSDIVL